ncbi:excisionase family DNA-binding protein [Verrucomicrobia bacterium]|nr:excisionase family DNA-binding protein [Verrucomicrobiota bacterium]
MEIRKEKESEYLTKQELANYLRVSLRTIDNFISRRTVPFVRLGGRMVRFPRTLVDDHIRTQLIVRSNRKDVQL